MTWRVLCEARDVHERLEPAEHVLGVGVEGRWLTLAMMMRGVLRLRPVVVRPALRASYSSATRPQVLLMDSIELARTDLERLAAHAEVLVRGGRLTQRNDTTTRDELKAAFSAGGKYSAVSGLYRHFGGARSIRVSGRFDEDLVRALPPSLKFIVHNGAGYDQCALGGLTAVDIPALTARGIQAANVPTVVNEATADTALFLMLGALRRFGKAMSDLRAGRFNSAFDFRDASDPQGLTLGIVGAGGIGGTLARKAAHALGMHVVYHNRRRLSDEQETQGMPAGQRMEYALSLDSLLGQSDVVSLHCPLTPSTKHLIGAAQLARMQSHAVLINTARGPVVDEAALVQALDDGAIAGVGLDVYEAEPRVHEGLLRHADTKAFLLPHVGTLSLQTQTDMEAVCLRNLEHGLRTGRLRYTVREQEGVTFS